MTSKIRLVTGDTRPFIQLTLRDKAGNPINLSDVDTSVVVHFRALGSTEIIATITCVKVGGGADGMVLFNFPEGVLDVEPGPYEGEIEIRFGDDRQTVFDALKFNVREQFA